VIKPSRVRDYAKANPKACGSLMAWLRAARKANWKNLHEVRQTMRSADGVKVASGNTVTVFNIGGNNYRLIVAIHFNRRMLYVLRFLSHAEYDSNKWKAEL
jgi:mRNA interferase HigB